MTRVYLHDIKAMDYCNRGSRPFFSRHGLDWSDFLRNGIDAQLLIDTGDAMAIKVAKIAEDRERRESNGR